MLVHEIKYIYYDYNHKKTIVKSNIEYGFQQKPIDVIESLCYRYGLSIEGSFNAIKYSLNIHQKCPILVHPLLQVYFFPTCSMFDFNCIWINSKQIKLIKKQDYLTNIIFIDGSSVLCDVGVRSIKKQLNRCRMMEERILKQYQIDQLSLKV